MVQYIPPMGGESDESSPSLGSVALVVLLGVGMLGHPLYLWPQYNQTLYTLGNVQPVSGDSIDHSSVIEYQTLPETAQRSFTAARNGDRKRLWSGDNDQAIDTLQDHQYVLYQGTYYAYDFTHHDGVSTYTGLFRGLLTAIGVFLVTFGSLVAYSNSWRPISPLRSLLFVSFATAALVATQIYDVLYSGASGQLPLPNNFLSLIPVVMAFLGAGSLVRRRGRSSVVPVAAIAISILIIAALIFNTPPVVPLLIGLILTGAGIPWMALGYVFTMSSNEVQYQ